MGSPRSLIQSLEARKLTAYHEGGHALVALYTRGAKPIHKATIVPRGHALGMVSQVPDKDEYSTSKQQMLAYIDVCMGGKAAEELIFGADQVTSGAPSDLKTATRMAKHMVEECGMSDIIGPVAVLRDGEYGQGGGSGGEVRKTADEEISKMLKEAYSRVAMMLKNREQELHQLASALLEKETLTQREIKELLWGPQAAEEDDEMAAAAAAAEGVVVAAGDDTLDLNGGGGATTTTTASAASTVASPEASSTAHAGGRG